MRLPAVQEPPVVLHLLGTKWLVRYLHFVDQLYEKLGRACIIITSTSIIIRITRITIIIFVKMRLLEGARKKRKVNDCLLLLAYTPPANQPIEPPISQPINQSTNQLINQSISHPVNPPVNQSVHKSTNHQSINQSINQPTSQSISHLVNQSIN